MGVPTMRKTTSPYISVKKSKIHNKGVFAKKDVPEGTRVIEYVGEKITKRESDNRYDDSLAKHKKNQKNGAVYVFELNKRYDIDGNVSWNTAKNINHSCDPNCEVDIIRGKIWIIALRDIKKGEELSYNYGYAYDGDDEHKCLCRTASCIGYILDEDDWPKFLKTTKKSFQKAHKNSRKDYLKSLR